MRQPPCKRRASGAVALLLSAGWAFAEGRSAKAREALPARDLYLDVAVEGQSIGLIGSFRQDGSGALYSRRKELAELGIRTSDAGEPDDGVPLAAIKGLSYRYDEAAQRIDLKLTDAARLSKTYDASSQGRAAPAGTAAPAMMGAVLNYSLYGSSDGDRLGSFWRYPSLSAMLDGRIFSPAGVLSQTGIVSDHSLSGGGTDMLRLDTTWSYSDEGSMMSYRAGDVIVGGLPWTRPIRMGGVQVQRNFGLRPDLITQPLPSVGGSAAVPSTVDVFLNGTKALSQDVGTGPFRITNIPILSGNGNASVVVRDVTGQQTETSLPFIVSSKLLRPGLFDISAEIGAPRLDYGLRSGTYDNTVAASASARYGLSDTVTMTAHAEATRGLGLGGLGVVLGLGQYGLLSAAGSGSWNDGAWNARTGIPETAALGGQAYLSFETQLWGLSFVASSQRSFGAYRDLASMSAASFGAAGNTAALLGRLVTPHIAVGDAGAWTALSLPPLALDRVSIGTPVPVLGGAVGVGMAYVKPASGRSSRIVNASYTRAIGKGGSMYATVFSDLSERRSGGVFAGFSWPLGPDVTVSTGASRSRNGWSVAADASKALRPEVGSFGWRIRDVEGSAGQQRRSASLGYRGNLGQIEAGLAETSGRLVGTAQLDGSIVLAGGDVFVGNRIDDAFAVVKTGTPDIEVLYENRVAARTNGAGNALVPGLRSYQSNRISIDPSALPLTSLAETTIETRAPSDRAGVVVDFGVRSAANAAIVILRGADGQPLPVGSRGFLAVGLRGASAAELTFTVGYDGRAFVENLARDNDVVIRIGESECRARFAFAPREDTQVTVGPVPCR